MNISAFPFFDSLDEMRKACKTGATLKCPRTRFLPFQIAKPRDNQPIDCINVYRANGSLYRTIMGNQIAYTYHQTASVDFITYYGAALSEPLVCGDYYLEISGRYSAIFSALNSVADLLLLEWRNDANLFDTEKTPVALYTSGYLQRLHLEAEVKTPTYPYEETGYETEFKEFVQDFKKVSKQSQFTTVMLPPYLADALGALPMHSQVKVNGLENVRGIEVSPEWLDFGTGASVTVTFEENNPIVWTGCEPMEVEQYDLSGYTPRGFLCGIPDTNAAWVNTGNTRCEQVNGQNTGYQMIEQRDQNPDSATFNSTREIRSSQPNLTACAVPVTYQSREMSEYVLKNDCQEGYNASTVLVRVNAGAFTSTISQIDADNKALAHLNATKQATANANGTCTPAPVYLYAGRISARFATPTQACAATLYTTNVYSSDGTFTHATGIKLGPNADAQQVPNGYYRRQTDGKSIDVFAGMVNSVYSCGNDEYEEF